MISSPSIKKMMLCIRTGVRQFLVPRYIGAGFTLIETLVAVLILTTAIAGPLTIASKGLLTSLVAKDQVTAYYLAQDALEYIRFKRDTTCLTNSISVPCDPATWLSSLSLCTSAGGSNACYVDSRTDTITACASKPCPIPINYDAGVGRNYFSYTSGTATIFKRTVAIVYPFQSRTNEAQVVITVSWNDVGNVLRSVVVSENLMDWE